MALLPPRYTTINQIYKHYEQQERKSPPRLHLGASEIGNECERQIWYSFRWVMRKAFDGRMLRLFETGNLEEGRIVANLTAIEVDVKQFDLKSGRQFKMEMFGGHFAGSLDGIALGIIEAPKTWHLTEYKTHNDKSFKSLCKSGVQKSKPTHYSQMQTYMGMSHEGLGGELFPVLTRALYLAVNKNTDELYAERIEYDPIEYLKIKEKARRIIFNSRPLPKISEDADFFICKFCDFRKNCHKLEVFEKPLKNCRTCIYSTPLFDGGWRCEKFDKLLCLEEQIQGCEKHLYIPDLLPYKQIDATENTIVYSDDVNTYTNYEGGELVQIATSENKLKIEEKKSNLPWE